MMVHILLSTYNGARYLAQQLDSILAQTYTDWRLYIRDDGSSDGTVALAETYAKRDKRVVVVRDGENLGAMGSFMRLLEQQGDADYFAFADQDDYWAPEKIALCVEAIQKAEAQYPDQPIVVHTDLQVVDSDLQPIAPSFWQYSNIRPDLLDRHIRYMAICNSVTGCTMLFNAKARACAMPVTNRAFMHDAWIALMTMKHGGKVIPLYQTPICYRQHGDNTIGATRYSVMGRTVEKRLQDAEMSYSMAHPIVYANKLQFWVWKTIYLLHRALCPVAKS